MIDLVQHAKKALERFEETEGLLSLPETVSDMAKYTELSKLHKSLEKVAHKSREYLSIQDDINEWTEALKDGSDPEMQKAAEQELIALQKKMDDMSEVLKFLIIPKDPNDLKNVLLEIRAGTGGDEASIFAGDLHRMYESYVESLGWKMRIISLTEGTMGGFKEIISEIEGDECYGILKHESGVHRVQRVPVTESQGRVHTSAATVAVMPQAEDVDIDINENELRIDTYRSSGCGGQHVNTTDSAIRITHLPTNLVVTCQDEKSQLKNKEKAMKVLRSRLLDQAIAAQEKDRAQERKSQVGTGDRSAKIRTYNFPQGRMTDHRINLTLYALDSIIKGHLDDVVAALRVEEMTEKLRELE
ncbi:MAG: peptide chain release factor 1 [Fibrobacteria bacterium]|nr:peptide chain release factor 1 [Fibrobacteria bacterium]